MKKYHLRDIPSKERWKYFWSYYKLQVAFVVCFLVMAGYTLYLLFLRPRTDVVLLWLSDKYDLACEGLLCEEMEQEFLDTDKDGRVTVSLSYVQFDGEYDELSQETRAEIAVLVSAHNTYIFLADQDAVKWLEEKDLLGSWGDLGSSQGGNEEEIFKADLSSVAFFNKDVYDVLQECQICIAKPPEENTESYDLQMKALRDIIKCE